MSGMNICNPKVRFTDCPRSNCLLPTPPGQRPAAPGPKHGLAVPHCRTVGQFCVFWVLAQLASWLIWEGRLCYKSLCANVGEACVKSRSYFYGVHSNEQVLG